MSKCSDLYDTLLVTWFSSRGLILIQGQCLRLLAGISSYGQPKRYTCSQSYTARYPHIYKATYSSFPNTPLKIQIRNSTLLSGKSSVSGQLFTSIKTSTC